MNMNRSAAVPARIDGLERDLPILIRDLIPAEKFLSVRVDCACPASGL